MIRRTSTYTSHLAMLLAMVALSNQSHASTAIWDGGHQRSQSWEEPSNWSNNVQPQSGIDSIRFHAPAPTEPANQDVNASLHETFIVGSGKRMDSTPNAKGVLRISNSGHLIIANGGTLDFASQGDYSLAEGNGTMRFTIEAGAIVKLKGYYNGNQLDHTTHFIANETSVTPIEVSHSAFIRGGCLEVDLEHYDLRNGTQLVLFTQARHAPQSTGFSEVRLTEGWSGTIDYHYTTTDGQQAIALTDLENKGHYVDIPEPHSYALIFSTVTAVSALIRRRRL